MSAKRTPRFRKSLVVQVSSSPAFATSKSTTPFAARRHTPSNVGDGKCSAPKSVTKSKGWDFDFSQSPARSSKVSVKIVKDGAKLTQGSTTSTQDDIDDIIPPSQAIESDDDDDGDDDRASSAGTSPILTVAEPEFKRLRLATNDDEADNDSSSSDEILPTARTLDFEYTKLIEKAADNVSEHETGKSRIIDQFDFEQFSWSRNEETEIVESFDSQTSDEERPKKVENMSETSNRFTGAQWLRQLGNKDKFFTGSMASSCTVEQITSASSPSSPSQMSIDQRGTTGTASTAAVASACDDSKKKKRAKFGLGLKLETLLRNRQSDAALHQHIFSSKTLGNHARPTKKGRVVGITMIDKTSYYVKCLQVASKPDVIFKFIYTASSTDEDILKLGSDVTISGPWSSFNSVSGEESLTSFVGIEISGNGDPETSFSSFEVLLQSDCDCHNRKTNSEPSDFEVPTDS